MSKTQSENLEDEITVEPDPLKRDGERYTDIQIVEKDEKFFIHSSQPSVVRSLFDNPLFTVQRSLCSDERNGTNFTEYASSRREAASYDVVYDVKGSLPLDELQWMSGVIETHR